MKIENRKFNFEKSIYNFIGFYGKKQNNYLLSQQTNAKGDHMNPASWKCYVTIVD